MKKLLIATKNEAKLAEYQAFLAGFPVELISLADLTITDSVVEDGKTYEDNAKKKALFYAEKSGLLTLADDAGLEITALGGKPGIHSRRWLGYEATDAELTQHLYTIARDLPDDNRQAFFKTVIAVAHPHGEMTSVAGEIEGVIVKEPLAELIQGYPYRAFFYLPQVGKYYQEITQDSEKQRQYNHRYHALEKLKPQLAHLLSMS